MERALVRGIVARGEAAARHRVAAVVAATVARVGREMPEIGVEAGNRSPLPGAETIVLRGPGLLARAFGSRHRPADPRLAAIIKGE